jgi:hypothetical protein
MGYYMHQTGGAFAIRAEKIPDALNALIDFDKGMNSVDASLSPSEQFAAILGAWRWEIEVAENSGDVTRVTFMGEKLRDDDELFRSIAKFVEAGSYIEMVGGDDTSWRWYFDGEDMITRTGTTVFDGDKPKVVIHVRGGIAEVASCPESVTVEIVDHDKLDQAA